MSHRVESFTVWHLGDGDDVTPIRAEFSAKEKVHKEYLSNNVDKVECLAKEESEGIPLIVILGVREVIEEVIDPVILVIRVHNGEI